MTVTSHAKWSKHSTRIRLPPPLFIYSQRIYVEHHSYRHWCMLLLKGVNKLQCWKRHQDVGSQNLRFRQRSSWIFTLSAFGRVPRWSTISNLVRTEWTVRKLLRSLLISKWRPASILHNEFPVFDTAGLFLVKSRCQKPNFVRIGWTILKLFCFKPISGFCRPPFWVLENIIFGHHVA